MLQQFFLINMQNKKKNSRIEEKKIFILHHVNIKNTRRHKQDHKNNKEVPSIDVKITSN